MRFRKLFITTAAVMAAGALAIAPAAQAAAPSLITVGSDTSNTSHTVSGTYTSGNVTMQTLFGNVTVGCSSGSIAGAVNGGSFGTPPPNPAFDFTGINLNCTSFIPGTTVAMSVTGCTVKVDLSDVTSGVSTGLAHFADSTGKACVKVTVSSGCTLYIGGDVPATFTNSTQELKLNGSGAKVYSNPAAPSGCAGLVSTGYTLTMNNIKFTASAPDGTISVS